uniref:Uncharacterized protein n=1 Tax=Triticum urartu TaxID=4572 RepID=A0A8R7K2W6_TRIUA
MMMKIIRYMMCAKLTRPCHRTGKKKPGGRSWSRSRRRRRGSTTSSCATAISATTAPCATQTFSSCTISRRTSNLGPKASPGVTFGKFIASIFSGCA